MASEQQKDWIAPRCRSPITGCNSTKGLDSIQLYHRIHVVKVQLGYSLECGRGGGQIP